jgi:hypothetical protein
MISSVSDNTYNNLNKGGEAAGSCAHRKNNEEVYAMTLRRAKHLGDKHNINRPEQDGLFGRTRKIKFSKTAEENSTFDSVNLNHRIHKRFRSFIHARL